MLSVHVQLVSVYMHCMYILCQSMKSNGQHLGEIWTILYQLGLVLPLSSTFPGCYFGSKALWITNGSQWEFLCNVSHLYLFNTPFSAIVFWTFSSKSCILPPPNAHNAYRFIYAPCITPYIVWEYLCQIWCQTGFIWHLYYIASI